MPKKLKGVSKAEAGRNGTAIIYNPDSGKIYGLMALTNMTVSASSSQGVMYVKESPTEVNSIITKGAFVKDGSISEGWLPLKNRGIIQVSGSGGKLVEVQAPYGSSSPASAEFFKAASFKNTGTSVGKVTIQLDENGKAGLFLSSANMPSPGNYLIRITHPEFGKITLKAHMQAAEKEKPDKKKKGKKVTELPTNEETLKKILDGTEKGAKKISDAYSAVSSFIDKTIAAGKPVTESEIKQELERLVKKNSKEVQDAVDNSIKGG